MGVDVYLRSIDDGFEPSSQLPGEEPSAYVQRSLFTERLARGGYFRDAYNRTNLLNALGLTWNRDVEPMLVDGDLPIPAARHLLAELEARLVTPAIVEDVGNGRIEGELQMVGTLREMFEGEIAPPTAESLAEITAFLTERRRLLMALLRKSIAMDEPLACSM